MNLVVTGNTYRLNKTILEEVAKAAFSYLKAETQEGMIELRFVSKKQIQNLNQQYRNMDAPTDVLSFNLSNTPLVGQIVICYTYTGEQARKMNKMLDDEVALLLVHGILHIFGYDHVTLKDEAAMQKIEKVILNMENIRR